MLRESNGLNVGNRCVSYVVAGAVLLTAGCAVEMVPPPPPAEPAEEVSAAEQALTGPLRIHAEPGFADSCEPDDKWVLRTSASVGRAVAMSNAFEDCMMAIVRRGTRDRGPYAPCTNSWPFPSDPYASMTSTNQATLAIARARSTNPVRVECENFPIEIVGFDICEDRGCTPPENVHGYPHEGGDDEIIINYAYLDDVIEDFRDPGSLLNGKDELESLAGLLWHEGMHTKGYQHENFPGGTECGTAASMNVLTQRCIEWIIEDSMEHCGEEYDGDINSCGGGRRYRLVDGFNSETCECVADPSYPTFDASEVGDQHGAAMATWDMNCDGFDDLAVGTPGDGGGRVDYYEGTIFGLRPFQEWPSYNGSPTNISVSLGSALAAGKISEGNCQNALLMGDPGGRYVTLSFGTRETAHPLEIYATSNGANQFGRALAMGDLNGDGVDEAVVAAANAVYIYELGTVTIPWYIPYEVPVLELVRTIRNPGSSSDNFGQSVAVGNFAWLGPTVVVGAPNADRVWYFTDAMNPNATAPAGSATPSIFGVSPNTGVLFGWSVTVGNFAGDGYDGLAISAPWLGNSAGDRMGAVFVLDFNEGWTHGPTFMDSQNFYSWGALLRLTAGTVHPTSGRDQLVAGNAWETVNGNFQAGSVQVWDVNDTGLVSLGQFDQGTLGEHSSPELNDAFGTSVAVGRFKSPWVGNIAVGAPGEGAGSSPATSGAVLVAGGAGEYLDGWYDQDM